MPDDELAGEPEWNANCKFDLHEAKPDGPGRANSNCGQLVFCGRIPRRTLLFGLRFVACKAGEGASLELIAPRKSSLIRFDEDGGPRGGCLPFPLAGVGQI